MALTSWEEQRKAPRIMVDVEGEMHIDGHTAHGVSQDLSFGGSLYVPDRLLPVAAGKRGQFRFALPTSMNWIEPRIEIRRVTQFPRANGQEAQAIGFQFLGLSENDERAIAQGCHEWLTHKTREYPLSVRCFLNGTGTLSHFSRYGRLTSGGRRIVRVALTEKVDLDVGAKLRLKVGMMSIDGDLERVTQDLSGGMELRLGLTGWGRDFFLHEARKGSMGSSLSQPPTNVSYTL